MQPWCHYGFITQNDQSCKLNVQICLFGIRKIGQIRQFLDQDTANRLAHAFVTSRLDSCNSLLYGLPESEIKKLQRLQNIAARLVLQLPKRTHITLILRQLHWLLVRQRLEYKILIITYKVMYPS